MNRTRSARRRDPLETATAIPIGASTNPLTTDIGWRISSFFVILSVPFLPPAAVFTPDVKTVVCQVGCLLTWRVTSLCGQYSTAPAARECRNTSWRGGMTMPMIADSESVQAVVRLRTLGPSGLNPPQTEVIDRLQTLSEDEDGPLNDLDMGMWGPSMGSTQTEHRGPFDTRETVAEFKQWADAYGYTLRPAFDWHSTDSAETGNGQIVTPLITLAVYKGEHLKAVYPHVDGDEVNTIHDGVEALESMAGLGDTEQSDDERSENETLVVPLQ